MDESPMQSTEKLLFHHRRNSESDISDEIGELAHKRSNQSSFHSICWQALIHVSLFTIYTAFIFSFWPKKIAQSCVGDNIELYTPAQSAIKWETRVFENSLETGNPYKGAPSKELDHAWNQLLDPSAIRVSQEDLDKINRTSVPILDGSGYMATLDVYHQLHCLRWVRQMIHPDYYEMKGKEKNLGQHVDHCLDALRQFVMCKADVVLLTYDWLPNFHRPWPNFEIEHRCANWDSIHEWAVEHSFDGFDDKLIKHPNFHPELGSPFSYAVSGNEVLD